MMAGSLSCSNLISKDVGNDSCFCYPDFKESCVENEYSTPSIMEQIVKGMPFEDLDISSINEKDDLMVKELERALSGLLHVCDSYQLLCGTNPTTDHDETCSPNEMDITFLGENILEDFNKCATVQWTEQAQSPPSPLDVREGLLSIMPHVDSSTKLTTPKLVSAMKGSRAHEGMPLKSKLSVKWAPDVYDPPPTSESHTVKGHHRRRPRTQKKDYHKQKHGKGKYYKGNSCDRKYASRKSTGSIINPRILSLAQLSERAAVNGHPQSEVEVMDYSGMT